MGESSYFHEVWNIVKTFGGKMWAVYGEAVLYIRDGKLWVNWLNTGYSINVGEIWCERWLENKRKMNRRLPV